MVSNTASLSKPSSKDVHMRTTVFATIQNIIKPSKNGLLTKTYEFLRGMFGGPLPRNALPIVMATPEDGCGPITNAAEVAGKIAIVVRGACMFTNKGTNVEQHN